jgi:hypothetical protein
MLRRSSLIAECFYTCKIPSSAQVYFSATPYLEVEQKTKPLECLTCQGEQQQYKSSRVYCMQGRDGQSAAFSFTIWQSLSPRQRAA